MFDKNTLKRSLAWLSIIVIVGLFIYFSLQSYHLLTGEAEAPSANIASTEMVADNDATTRTNWPEVVGLLIVGTALIYAIKKTNREIDEKRPQPTTADDSETNDNLPPNA